MKKALEKIEERFAMSHEERELKEIIDYTNANALFKLEVTCSNGFKYSSKHVSRKSLQREIDSIERNKSWDKRAYEVITIK